MSVDIQLINHPGDPLGKPFQIAQEQEKEERGLKVVSAHDLLTMQIPVRRMILSPIIPEKGLVMLYAPRGLGKTYVALFIAYVVATSGKLFKEKWIASEPRKVLLVDGEMPATVLQERIKKIAESKGNFSFADENLSVIAADLQENSIPDLSTIAGQQLIEEHLDGVKLLILDNLSSLCRAGRENESESWVPMQEWLLSLRRRGISVLLVHHANKAGNQRGNSKKEDILDTVIVLRKSKTYDPQDGAKFEMHYEKARGFYGDAAKPLEVQLKELAGQLVWVVTELEDAESLKILELHTEGLTQREIAEDLGMSPATVNRRLKKAKEDGKIVC